MVTLVPLKSDGWTLDYSPLKLLLRQVFEVNMESWVSGSALVSLSELPTIHPERRNAALAILQNLKSLKAGGLVFRTLRALLNDGV